MPAVPSRDPGRAGGSDGGMTQANQDTTAASAPDAHARVLVVDDDPHLLKALRITLAAHGYAVDAAADGASALLSASRHAPDLLILDLGLPDMDGVEVLRDLRRWSTMPVLVLSARRRLGGQGGCPGRRRRRLHHRALRAGRTAGTAARPAAPCPCPGGGTRGGLLCVQRGSGGPPGGPRRHCRSGSTPPSGRSSKSPVLNPNRLITQQQLLARVWGTGYVKEANYLRVYMAQLRRKLEADAGKPRHLLTEPGIGYRFVP